MNNIFEKIKTIFSILVFSIYLFILSILPL